jgi:hypothetical protein
VKTALDGRILACAARAKARDQAAFPAVADPRAGRFSIPDLPEGVVAKGRPARDGYDTILLFAITQAELLRSFSSHAGRLTVAGGLWVCWPKKASGLQRDLTESQVRAVGLDAGLVDVKVCAVDETWSGLRFVRRLADR